MHALNLFHEQSDTLPQRIAFHTGITANIGPVASSHLACPLRRDTAEVFVGGIYDKVPDLE